MIRPAGSLSEKPDSATDSPPAAIHPTDAPSDSRESGPSAYGAHFWLAYVGNLLVMIAIALLFRYSDFVEAVGGTEFHLGWIVGIGMVGSLAVRLVMGQVIDGYGPRLVWLGSLVLFAASCFGHLAVARHDGVSIYLLRIGYSCALAGIFGGSLTFITLRVPVKRMAEMWGMLGTAGFVGMIVGPHIGDWLVGGGAGVSQRQIHHMFLGAGLLASVSLVFAYLATRNQPRRAARPRAPLWPLLRRYHPGTVLMVGVAMGVGLGLPMTFVRPFSASLGFERIGLFFTCYGLTAIAARVWTRRWPERIGPEPLIVLGLTLMAGTQLLFLLVGTRWQMILPGVGYGMAHALIFPSTVAAASSAFPNENRGVGNLLILAMFDLGILVGAPTLGMVLELARRMQLPPYPMLFLTATLLLGLTAVIYRLTWRRAGRPWAHVDQAAPWPGAHPSESPAGRHGPAETALNADDGPPVCCRCNGGRGD